MNTQIKWIITIVAVGIAAAGAIVWLVYFNTPALNTATNTGSQFAQSENRTSTTVTETGGTNTVEPVIFTEVSDKKIFKIANGPIAGATLIQITRPATSTIARFVIQTNGHAFDLILDSPGAVPKAVSNTTIPGIIKVTWSEKGRGALMQYFDASILKTVHFLLPPPASTSTVPVRVQFLPEEIASLAVSPDGANVAYLVKTAGGSDGYTANADGGSVKKLFSLPLSQISIAWPSADTLLAQSAPSASVPGVVFSIDAKTGANAPLIYANGLTAVADRSFSRVIYQTADTSRSTYVRDTKTGLSKTLSFDPIPEQCIFGNATSTTMYCATPLAYVPVNYLDLRHTGKANTSLSILSFNVASGRSSVIATPGTDGGEQADIAEMSISADDKYLIYIRKGDRSLWAVRLTQ